MDSKDQLKKFAGTILEALDGKFQTASDMRESLLHGLSHARTVQQPKPRPIAQRTVPQSSTVRTSSPHPSRYQNQRNKNSSHFLETVLVVIIVSLLYVLYIYGELL